MRRLIILGSSRAHGRSAALVDALFEACVHDYPEDAAAVLSVAALSISGCLGCDACRATTEIELPDEDDPLYPCARARKSRTSAHRCIMHDDMDRVRLELDAANELIVVTPVYFASVPSQLKALLDRLQPYFWTNLRTRKKRPCTLHLVGEGKDPWGYDGAVRCVQSALSCAGFEVVSLMDWVGKLSSEGEILADADEYVLVESDEDESNEDGE